MNVVDYLQAFNRKERFYLVGAALGNPGFTLSVDFRARIGMELGLEVPPQPFVAMDYHLDWIYASLYLHEHGGSRGPHPNAGKLIRAQQEDVDLLVAYQDQGVCRLILLEAKGATGFGNIQFRSKTARLREIFGETGEAWSGVAPYFIITSPTRPRRLDTKSCPTWMLRKGEISWIEMKMREAPVKVTRCTEDGRPSARGEYWKVVPA